MSSFIVVSCLHIQRHLISFLGGKTLTTAFEQSVIAMSHFMTQYDTINIDENLTHMIQVSAHDLESLLFKFMDEVLFQFSGENFICKSLTITLFHKQDDEWCIRAKL